MYEKQPNYVRFKGWSLKNLQNSCLVRAALRDDAVFLFDVVIYALGSALTAEKPCPDD
ncbi:hypothetical protein L798_09347 [Zootermopsis nevadensis]|uniref:Uncharacterized protein n=1 Tax=Zootermopsis nevadensis TaxID=136037 RepID=A0A067R3Z6_ZOONE|nr:hypothetical protein L798_09347 [Zootermopsis nevadensis]